MPALWEVSLIAEEFRISPLQAQREIDEAPVGFFQEILEMRQFRDAYLEYHRPRRADVKLRSTPMIDLVVELDFRGPRGGEE